MVVLSAAVCSRQGKSLFARQFVEMQRSRIESLLSAFPKLMGTTGGVKESKQAKARQHTFIETENVRYLFQPLESVYLVIITNKASNIVEDLETMRLLAKIVPEYCGGIVSEQSVLDNVFELIFAFDEVISLGYRESISLAQVRINLEMDSHEEKLHDMIQKSKEEEARREAKKKAKQMQAERRERAKQGLPSMGSGGGGISSASYDGQGSSSSISSSSTSSSSTSSSSSSQRSSRSTSDRKVSKSSKKVGGMMIGSKKKKQSKFLSGMSTRKPDTSGDAGSPVTEEPAAPQAPNHITLHEDLTISMKQEMTVESMSVKGYLAITCRDAEFNSGCMNIQLDNDMFDSANQSGFAFKANPKINSSTFKSDRLLSLKNKSRGFPVGKPTKILQWRMSTNDESNVPLTFNCWPESQGDGTVSVTIEYTLENTNLTLYDVNVRVPLGSGEQPEILRIEEGSHRHNSRQEFLEWGINSINEDNGTAAMEFVIAGDDEDTFFPVEVSFQAETLLSGTNIVAVEDDEGNPISFSKDSSLRVQEYTISFE